MTRILVCCACWIAALSPLGVCFAGEEPAAASFTRLVAAPAKVVAAAPEFPGGGYSAANIVKPPAPGGFRSEYASHGQGERTFVDFDLGRTVRVAAFRHMQRRTIDTMAEAKLVFSDAADFKNVAATVTVKHVDQAGATTFAAFAPVAARFVRWQVTKVLPGRSWNLGGQAIEFFAAGPSEPQPRGIGVDARTVQVIDRKDGRLVQPLKLALDYPYAERLAAVVAVEGQPPRPVELTFGRQTLDYTIAARDTEQTLDVGIEAGGAKVVARSVAIPPMRKLTVYVLPHSHTDIGYTALQTDIEEKQINNALQGMADARRTADYPEGARFVWNVEVTWAADLLLSRASPRQRAEFFEALKRGQIALDGMYLNELTGLCRPEELLRLFHYTKKLGAEAGVTIDSAMISDVPGYTWGTVTAMAQAGIKYFSVAPNYFDRIGTVLVEWENKPFWWIGPDGRSKVLVWIPFRGYGMSHIYGKMSPQFVEEFCDGLQERGYPYDIAYMRWSGFGDNAPPDPAICDFIKQWNATRVWPRFAISSTSNAFRAFDRRYGDKLPQVRGDWTPYWEDGAGTSSAETAANRGSSERLTQAQTLWAMLQPTRYPAARFEAAWANVLLYSEHTWGAWCSVSQPAAPFTLDQWTIKQTYATTANLQSRQLLIEAVQSGVGRIPPTPIVERTAKTMRVDVFNTSPWPRTEVVLIPHEASEAGNFVTDDSGRAVPAQRLVGRELAVLVRDLAPYAGRRYTISPEGRAAGEAKATAAGNVVENAALRVAVDPKTGAVVELRARGVDANLVDASGGHAINDYLYLVGDDAAALKRNGPVKIGVRENGPLVASLLVEGDAPGCHKLAREIRLTAGGDCVELINTVDKKRLEAADYNAKEAKEGVHFAFPFNVPGGDVRLDAPLCVVRPEHDQMPSACKNWFTVGRWGDVANAQYGVTWVTLDAPMVQVGGVTGTLLGSQTNPSAWRKKIEPTQKLYSWAMNNHWHTNYRAYQEGPVVFRFVLRPHRGRCDDAEASRFATTLSQPLVALPGRGAPPAESLLRVEPADVHVVALKPSDDGKALVVRLFAAGGKDAQAKLTWPRNARRRLWLSDTGERPGRELTGDVPVPAWGVVTVRAELTR